MNNACFSTRGGSAAWVDVSPTDGEPATIESNGNLQEWACGEGRVIDHAEHFSICSEEFVSSLSSQRKVTLMMPYNQGLSSPALDYCIYLFRTITHVFLNHFKIQIAGIKGFLCGCAICLSQNLLGH